MLILSRRINEVIRVGDNILIRVSDLDLGKVEFSIESPVKVDVFKKQTKITYRPSRVK